MEAARCLHQPEGLDLTFFMGSLFSNPVFSSIIVCHQVERAFPYILLVIVILLCGSSEPREFLRNKFVRGAAI